MYKYIIYKSPGPPRRRTCLNLLISVSINLRSFVCLLQITCESCPAAECTTGLFTWMKIVTHYTSVPCKFHLSFSHALLLFFTPQTPLTGHFFQVAGIYIICVCMCISWKVYTRLSIVVICIFYLTKCRSTGLEY